MDLNKRHRYSFIALMEPFENLFELEDYKRKLGFEHAGVNNFGKIWAFLENNLGRQHYSQYGHTNNPLV